MTHHVCRPAWHSAYFGDHYLAVYSERLLEPEAAVHEAKFAMAALELEPGARVLDVPCGHGRHMLHLANAGCAVFGADLQREYLIRARGASVHSGAPPVRMACADMARLPFADSAFDAVLNLFNSFGYFPDDDADDNCAPGNRAVLREFARVLKPGGKALFDMPERHALARIIRDHPRTRCGGADWELFEEWRYDPPSKRVFNKTRFRFGDESSECEYNVRLYTREEFKRELAAAGLAIWNSWPCMSLDHARRSRERLVVAASKPAGEAGVKSAKG